MIHGLLEWQKELLETTNDTLCYAARLTCDSKGARLTTINIIEAASGLIMIRG